MVVIISLLPIVAQQLLRSRDFIEIYTPCATTCATEGDSRCIALSMYTALLTAAFGVDKKMLPENPLKHEMKLLKFEHNKLKNTQVDDKTYYNIIHLKI